MVAEGLTQMLPRNKTWDLSSRASDSYFYCMIYGLPISLKVKSEKMDYFWNLTNVDIH